MSRVERKIIYAILLLLSSSGFAIAVASDLDVPRKEKLLRYQEVFLHFYRKDALNALVNLRAGFETELISPVVESNRLLLGALYNNYGLTADGNRILNAVAASSRRQKIKDLAWFYLSKQYFENDELGAFITTAEKLKGKLPRQERIQFQYMLGMYYLKAREYTKARQALNQIERDSSHYNFLLFNLGAANLKAGKSAEGIRAISAVGQLDSSDEIMLALRDKANVLLGYHYLTSDQHDIAMQYFEKVHLEGPFSQKALLGLGWAYSRTNQHRRALVPWLLLSKYPSSALEVQEVLMAVPYTYNELGSKREAVAWYEKSIQSYESLKKKIEDAIGFVSSASLFGLLFVDDRYDDYAISEQLQSNLETDLGRFLFELLKEADSQEMLREYRDLLQAQSELSHWRDVLGLMNTKIGSVKNAAELPDLVHININQGAPGLPRQVAKKILYKEHLLTLGNRMALQEDRLTILLDRYEQKIREAMLKKLERRRQYVVTYLSQTRYSLAELLDKAQKESVQ